MLDELIASASNQPAASSFNFHPVHLLISTKSVSSVPTEPVPLFADSLFSSATPLLFPSRFVPRLGESILPFVRDIRATLLMRSTCNLTFDG